MADVGKVPKEQLSSKPTKTPTGEIVEVTNLRPNAKQQEWVNIEFSADDVKKIDISAVDSTGRVIFKMTITPTETNQKKFLATFPESILAVKINFVVYANTPGKAVNTQILGATVCERSPAEPTVTDTTTVGTTAGTTPSQTTIPTTVPVPGTTASGTTSGTTASGTTAGTTASGTPASTTASPGTTPAVRSKPVCLKMMENQGRVPGKDLKVTPSDEPKTTKVTFESPLEDDEFTPVWNEVIVVFPSGNALEVTFIPANKDNRPSGTSETKTVFDPTKPFTQKFDKPVEAKKIIVIVTPIFADKPCVVLIIEVEACIYKHAKTTTPAPGTTPGTTQGTTPSTTAGSTPGTTPESTGVTTTTPEPFTTILPIVAPKPDPVPLICTSPLEPSECLCHRTCDSMGETTIKCPAPGSSECHRGCQCPPGTVMTDGKCIKETDCPCYYKGKFYKNTDRVAVDGLLCTHMVCTSEGMKKVVDKECQPNVVCTSGRSFQLCPCERSCTDEKHTCDQTECAPGCACPIDTVWNGMECVAQTMCTCKDGNVTHTSGQSWDFGSCTMCHCINGVQKCAEICRITQEDCKKEGKKLLNKDLRDGVCCRCVSEEPHCIYKEEEKKIGDIWHEGLCTHYKCAKTSVGNGMIIKTQTECPECEQDEVKEYVANKCCPICRKKATTPVVPKTPETPEKGVERCPEVMKDTQEMNEKRVTLQPAKNSKPTDINPRGKGWTVNIDEKPTITLDCSTDNGARQGIVQALGMTGNAKSIVIKYIDVRPSADKPEEFKDYNKGKPIDIEKTKVTLVSPTTADMGLAAFKIQITVVEAIDRKKPLTIKLQFHACIEDAPEPCDETDLDDLVCTEIMKSRTELPSKRMTLSPKDKGTADDLRPSGEGWNVFEEDHPFVTVDLSNKDGSKPGLVEKCGVSGNVLSVKIEFRVVKGGAFIEYNDGKPVIVEKEEIVLKNPVTKQTGLIAFELRITPVAPVTKGKSYDMKLKIYACIQVEFEDVELPHDEPHKPKKDDHHHDEPHHDDPDKDEPKQEPTGCTDVLKNGEVPEDRITLSPNDKGTPEVILPSGEGWPVTPADKPSITADFSSPDGKLPGLVQEIGIFGNIDSVLIQVQEVRPRDDRKITPGDKLHPDGFKDYNDGKPIDATKPIEFKDPISDKPGLVVYRIRIIPLKPVHPDQPMNIRLRIIACVQDKKPIDSHDADEPKTPKRPHHDPRHHDEPSIACTEVMKDGQLDDKRIILNPANKGSPSDLRPTGNGWPVTKEDKPSATLDLASPNGEKPAYVEELGISGNVLLVNVEVMKVRPRKDRKIQPNDEMDPEGFKPYNDKPVDVSKDPIVFKSKVTKQPGILVYRIRITPVQAVDPTKLYNMKLKVKACIQDQPEGRDPHHSEPHHSDHPASTHKAPEEPGCVDIMDDTEEFPDNRVTITPKGKGVPADLRQEGKGLPAKKEDKPVIHLNLASKDNRKPGLLNKIKIFGNVLEALVRFRTIRPRPDRKITPDEKIDPQGYQKFNDGKPVKVQDLPLIFEDPISKTPGRMVYDVEITLLEPIKPDQPFNAKLKVYACIQDDLEVITKNELMDLLEFIKAKQPAKVTHA